MAPRPPPVQSPLRGLQGEGGGSHQQGAAAHLGSGVQGLPALPPLHPHTGPALPESSTGQTSARGRDTAAGQLGWWEAADGTGGRL